MSILEDIKANKLEELHLSNIPEDYFEKSDQFVDAMKSNTSIKSVVFDKDFLACTKGDDRAKIVSSLAEPPNVEKVVLKDSFLMVGICVTNLTKNASNLSELSMENCTLQGLPSDFDMFVDALKSNDHIKSLNIKNCEASHGEVDMSKVLNDLKDGLSIAITAE